MRFMVDSALDEAEEQGIDITPLIDVVFLLLIFFMVSTRFSDPNALDVQLPKASSKRTEQPAKELVVSVRKDGSIFVEGKGYTLDSLEEHFKSIQGSSSDLTLVLRGDTKAEYGKTVQVMDRARRQGIVKIAIATAAE